MGIQLLIAEDHEIVREGFRLLLQSEEGIHVVNAVPTGREAVDLARKLNPDIVVMDISMPDLNGIEATRQIVSANPRIRVIALSVHDDKRYITEMLRAGASGYLLKKGAFQELVQAIHAVMIGQVYLSPSITSIVVKDYLHHAPVSGTSPAEILSDREREIVQLIAEGKSMKQIAYSLDLSIKTISTHRQNILRKLHVDSVAALVKYAIREGMVTLEE